MLIESREQLAEIHGCGIGAELGVARGDFSCELLRRGRFTRLYSIDRWADHHDENEMRDAQRKLAEFADRSILLRATFADAVKEFDDGFFDFLYIDGYAHTGQEGGKTLRDWWPKLKSGGIFAGHDYTKLYPRTVEQVDRFVAEHGLTLSVTTEMPLASWWLIKP